MPKLNAGALLVTTALFAGCNAVLGISDDPVVSAPSASCQNDSDCTAPKICRFQVCSDPAPAQTGGGGEGGQESSGGGSPGLGQSGSAGSAGQATLPTPGEPCDNEGAVACAASASPERVVCLDGEYAEHEACGEGELCDRSAASSGSCAPVVAACQGRQPLEAFCEGLVRSQCGPDLVTIEQTTCDSVQLCNYGSGSACAACVPNQHHCSGDILQVCNDDHTGYDDVQTCMDEPCNAEAGACTIYACTPAGSQKCDESNNLVECAQDQMGFDIVEECGTGICDPAALECDVCSAGVTRCESGSAFECSIDGQNETSTVCEGGTPHCAGGACVECTQNPDCDPPDDCHTAYCNVGSGACVVEPKGEGAVCSGGVCDAAAACVECLTTVDQCDETTQVCRQGTCATALAAHPSGFNQPFAGADATLYDNEIYAFRLPQLQYDADLLKLGFYGKSGAGSVKMAIYASTVDGSRPTGVALAETSGTTWGATVKTQTPSPAITLASGTYYWLAIKSNADVVLRTQTNGAALGFDYTGYAYEDLLFPNIDDIGAAYNGVDFNIFIEVKYIE